MSLPSVPSNPMTPPLPLPLPLYPDARLKPKVQQMPTDIAKGRRIKIIVLATLAFAILSHMASYKLAEVINEAITGRSYQIVTEEGSPSFRGTLIMSAIFFGVMIYLMV